MYLQFLEQVLNKYLFFKIEQMQKSMNGRFETWVCGVLKSVHHVHMTALLVRTTAAAITNTPNSFTLFTQ